MLNNYPRNFQFAFEEAVVTGEFPAGKEVTPETLTAVFEGSIDSARQVLAAATRKGLVKPVEGETYQVVGKAEAAITSVFQHADKSGYKPKSIVRAVTIVPADAQVAARLHVPVGEPVFRQTRTRLVNDGLVANQNNYIPIEVCPGLEEIDLTRTSFQVTLEGKFHAVVAKIEEEFELVPATADDTEILGLEEGEEVLVVRRLSLSASGMPLVWADIHVCIRHFPYVQALWPQAAGLLEKE